MEISHNCARTDDNDSVKQQNHVALLSELEQTDFSIATNCIIFYILNGIVVSQPQKRFNLLHQKEQ